MPARLFLPTLPPGLGLDVGLGLQAGPHGIHPVQQGRIKATNQGATLLAALKARMIDADDHAARADKAGGPVQPRRVAGGSVSDADLIACVGFGAGGGAVGEFDKFGAVQLKDIQHQAGAPFGLLCRAVGVLIDRKGKQNNVTALDKVFPVEVRHEGFGGVIHLGSPLM